MIYSTPFLLLNVDACDWNFVLTVVHTHTHRGTHTHTHSFSHAHSMVAQQYIGSWKIMSRIVVYAYKAHICVRVCVCVASLYACTVWILLAFFESIFLTMLYMQPAVSRPFIIICIKLIFKWETQWTTFELNTHLSHIKHNHFIQQIDAGKELYPHVIWNSVDFRIVTFA